VEVITSFPPSISRSITAASHLHYLDFLANMTEGISRSSLSWPVMMIRYDRWIRGRRGSYRNFCVRHNVQSAWLQNIPSRGLGIDANSIVGSIARALRKVGSVETSPT
jgi:hypothetical protein